jgi:uncharacterized membrane protein YdjX (TVP38/TMEM64 family)
MADEPGPEEQANGDKPDRGTPDRGTPDRGTKAGSLTRFLPLILLAVGFLVARQMGWDEYLSLSALRDYRETLLGWVETYGFLAGLCFIGIYAGVIAFSIPGGLVLTLAAGFLFGTLLAACYVIFGATIGATAIFLAVKTAFGDLLRARAGPFLKKMETGFRENELTYMLVLRLIPLFPFWLVNIVPGFLGVSLRNYVLGTFLGIIPGTLVFSSVGSGIGQILDEYDAGNPPNFTSIILEPQYILPIIGLVVLAMLPLAYKRIRGRKGPDAT